MFIQRHISLFFHAILNCRSEQNVKNLPTRWPVLRVLKDRWSPRAFNPVHRVTPEELGSIFEAARLTASAWNEQPWRFIVGIRGQGDSWNRLFECLREPNQTWAKTSPVLILAVSKQYLEHRGPCSAATYRHGEYDLGQAVMGLVVQAQSMGLCTHQMAGFCPTKARKAFQIPELHEPMTVIAVGCRGAAKQLPDDLRARETAPRTRKELEELVFTECWGTPAEFHSPVEAAAALMMWM